MSEVIYRMLSSSFGDWKKVGGRKQRKGVVEILCMRDFIVFVQLHFKIWVFSLSDWPRALLVLINWVHLEKRFPRQWAAGLCCFLQLTLAARPPFPQPCSGPGKSVSDAGSVATPQLLFSDMALRLLPDTSCCLAGERRLKTVLACISSFAALNS